MPDIKEQWKEFKGKNIVLYGLGTETEWALGELDNYFKIVGLLDGFQDVGELYGKPILSLSQVINQSIGLIIVVARPGSCRVIAKRIGDFCRKYKIALYDIRGKNLLIHKRTTYEFKHLYPNTKEVLLTKIMAAQVVSFDLFDTLVMRQVLLYTDIFEILDHYLQEDNIVIPDFINRRLASEKELAKYGAPTLSEIYEHLLEGLCDKPDIDGDTLAEMEWKIDYDTIIPRSSVCNIYQEIVKSGKLVFIVTDTYYRKKQIKKILEKCDIRDFADIYVSCEYNTGKTQELFCKFKSSVSAQTYLHIGDDLAADIEFPSKQGMDIFHIYSGIDLLDELGSFGMEAYINNLADRVKIGLFVSRIFNNPFQFERETGKVEIQKSVDTGYLLCAPLLCDFLLWFCRRIREEGIRNVFFPSRDGYLLQKLYEMIEKKESIYFLTSRTAAIRAGMEDVSDIAYIDSMKFFGTADENLFMRFGIDSDKGLTTDEKEIGLINYSDAILDHAKIQRRNYKRYIEQLEIQRGDIAFFDFAAKGTTQMYVQKLVNHHLKGFYFLQLEPEFMKDKSLDIEPFYSREETDNSVAFDDYYILETILTAPYPQVLEFDEFGNPVYAKETRNEQSIRCVNEIQEGILDYFKVFVSLVPKELWKENKKLDEEILRLFHQLKMTDENFKALMVEDPFFNRMTQMTDLI